MPAKYRVVGRKENGYAVVDVDGGIEYDLLEHRALATGIRNVLNEGIGPEWNAVSVELERKGISTETGERKAKHVSR